MTLNNPMPCADVPQVDLDQHISRLDELISRSPSYIEHIVLRDLIDAVKDIRKQITAAKMEEE